MNSLGSIYTHKRTKQKHQDLRWQCMDATAMGMCVFFFLLLSCRLSASELVISFLFISPSFLFFPISRQMLVLYFLSINCFRCFNDCRACHYLCHYLSFACPYKRDVLLTACVTWLVQGISLLPSSSISHSKGHLHSISVLYFLLLTTGKCKGLLLQKLSRPT